MLISRFFLMMTSTVLAAAACLGLLGVAGLALRKLYTSCRWFVSFLLLAALYMGLRSLGIYWYAFDAVHRPSTRVSALNLGTLIVFCPAVVCGVVAIVQVRRETTRKRLG